MKDRFIVEYQKIERQIYFTALGYLHNTEDARDAVQSAVLSAYQAYPKLRRPEYFKTWLTAIVINECKDFLKKRYPYEELTDEIGVLSELPEQEFEMMDTILKLEPALSSMIVLRFYNELTYREVSKMLGMPESTVKHKTQLALGRLKTILEGANNL